MITSCGHHESATCRSSLPRGTRAGLFASTSCKSGSYGAEQLADLPKLNGGILHPYRRLWASERKHMPDIDVAAAGGWKDSRALKFSYQHADPATGPQGGESRIGLNRDTIETQSAMTR